MNVQSVLKKASALPIEHICSLHGPVLNDKIQYYIDTYSTWSSYGVESRGVAIGYTSVYGNTKKAAEKLASLLKEKGCPKVSLFDIAREDLHECIEDAFRYGTLVLASTTYNGGVFPVMKNFIENLIERNYQNRKIAFIENGSWAPTAAKSMQALFAESRDITFAQNKVTMKIAMNEDVELQLEKLASELAG